MEVRADQLKKITQAKHMEERNLLQQSPVVPVASGLCFHCASLCMVNPVHQIGVSCASDLVFLVHQIGVFLCSRLVFVELFLCIRFDFPMCHRTLVSLPCIHADKDQATSME
ncbi:hypothetical protein OS493_039067 [Desmophyllum pertusum]|uniref:Uncharacterized protein n=1 Tax=Desmophyllum pertusum TaxID=174260 RepID=A0A9W9ZUR8_9CNID|nr:hypothetical protein OS493_039067 [Desmophyllum pertusum]